MTRTTETRLQKLELRASVVKDEPFQYRVIRQSDYIAMSEDEKVRGGANMIYVVLVPGRNEEKV